MAVILYDANGRLIPGAREEALRLRAMHTAGFRGAGRGRRAAGWYPTSASINSILASDAETLLPRSRDAFRNNPWAVSASDHYVSAIVGTGVKPDIEVSDNGLKRQLEDEFQIFTDNCDADGTQDYYGLQEIAARGLYEGGDSFARIRYRRPSDGLDVPVQFQMLDAEMCDISLNEIRGRTVIKSGIEINAIGKRVGYWMFPFHPGDSISTQSVLGNVSRRVRADVVLHCFHPRQAGQIRGVPGIAAVLALLKDLEDTSDAYVLRTKLQNLFVTFEETPDDDSILDAPDEAGDADDLLDADDVPIRALEPGTHVIGPPGHKFVHSTPPQDAGNLEDFLRASLRGVAMGAGTTYEMLTGDLRQTSFSSIRAGLVEYRRMMEARMQRHLVFQFCKPTYRAFLETAILANRVSLSGEELRRAMHPTWYGTPGWEYVDPDKEVKADVRAVRAGFTSRKAIVAKGGRRIERVDEELKEERSDKDLVLDTDPAAVADIQDRGEESGAAGEA